MSIFDGDHLWATIFFVSLLPVQIGAQYYYQTGGKDGTGAQLARRGPSAIRVHQTLPAAMPLIVAWFLFAGGMLFEFAWDSLEVEWMRIIGIALYFGGVLAIIYAAKQNFKPAGWRRLPDWWVHWQWRHF